MIKKGFYPLKNKYFGVFILTMAIKSRQLLIYIDLPVNNSN